jgi:threonine dehydrogenase-like Zn-dependent dehydrogenase
VRALVFDSQGGGPPGLRLARERAIPEPPPGEARIRTTLAGICNTDLEVVRGYAEIQGVLGHEFVGIVDQAEDASLVGRRVAGEISASCRTCPTCRAGRYTHCPTRTTLGIRNRDGVLADAFCLPVANLHPLPDDLPDEMAVFTEPLAAACQVLEQIQVKPTDRVIVLGDGKLGLLVAQVVAITGCDLVAVGRHQEKLATLAARGVATALDGEDVEGNADLVIECTGQRQGFYRARELVRPRGTLVLKSTYHGDLVPTDLSRLVVDEIRVVGSRCGPFPPAIRLLSQGLVDVLPLVEAEYPLDEALVAFEHAGRRGALKVLVRP